MIFGYGNPSRGDDALGPELLDLIARELQGTPYADEVELLSDYQLQVEHAVDLLDRQLVLFVDASVSAGEPCEFSPIQPERDNSYTTHAMSPVAVLSVFEQIYGRSPPPCFLLSLRGYCFDLGTPLSCAAENNLRSSLSLVRALLENREPRWWEEHGIGT